MNSPQVGYICRPLGVMTTVTLGAKIDEMEHRNRALCLCFYIRETNVS